MSLFGIRAGDIVTVRTPQGQVRTGRAQALLLGADRVVLDSYRRHGRGRSGVPIVATAANIVSARRPGSLAPYIWLDPETKTFKEKA